MADSTWNRQGWSNNTSKNLIVYERRRRVAHLRRQRYSMRQIAEKLHEEGITHPFTGKPYSLRTVFGDIHWLQDTARDEAIKDISEHRTEILADYQELLSCAWRDHRYEDVRKVLKDIRELLGTDAPQVIVFEQIAQRMHEAVNALEQEFESEPGILNRAIDALMGAGGSGKTQPRAVN